MKDIPFLLNEFSLWQDHRVSFILGFITRSLSKLLPFAKATGHHPRHSFLRHPVAQSYGGVRQRPQGFLAQGDKIRQVFV